MVKISIELTDGEVKLLSDWLHFITSNIKHFTLTEPEKEKEKLMRIRRKLMRVI